MLEPRTRRVTRKRMFQQHRLQSYQKVIQKVTHSLNVRNRVTKKLSKSYPNVTDELQSYPKTSEVTTTVIEKLPQSMTTGKSQTGVY